MDFDLFEELKPDPQKEAEIKAAKEKLLEKFTATIARAESCKVCISIDWLSVLFMDEFGNVKEPAGKDDVYAVTDRIALKYYGKGTEHYKFIHHLLYNGEHVATVLSHTRNEKFVRKGTIKVDFKNHLLYSAQLWPVYTDIVATFELRYRNISRLDIAVDGVTYLLEFLNDYVRQDADTKVVEMKGRPRINSKVLDRKQMLYQNFNIGVKPKFVTIYNKSLDIVKSGKNYIQEMWLQNGVCRELLPLELLAKAHKDEKLYLDGYENIFRFETRLSGEIIKKIDGFTIDWLKSSDWLMSIVKRTNENFFEFVWYTFRDVSKCFGIEIMPYHLYAIRNIELIKAEPRDDLYKTKLSLKKNVRQLFLGNLTPEDYSATEMIVFDVVNFKLQSWFLKKLPDWIKEFSVIQPDSNYCQHVQFFLETICQKFETKTEYEIIN